MGPRDVGKGSAADAISKVALHPVPTHRTAKVLLYSYLLRSAATTETDIYPNRSQNYGILPIACILAQFETLRNETAISRVSFTRCIHRRFLMTTRLLTLALLLTFGTWAAAQRTRATAPSPATPPPTSQPVASPGSATPSAAAPAPAPSATTMPPNSTTTTTPQTTTIGPPTAITTKAAGDQTQNVPQTTTEVPTPTQAAPTPTTPAAGTTQPTSQPPNSSAPCVSTQTPANNPPNSSTGSAAGNASNSGAQQPGMNPAGTPCPAGTSPSANTPPPMQ